MTRSEALHQAFAVCGAFLIVFIGLVHEVEGATLFPWAPAFFGPVLWHAIGAPAMLAGTALLAGVLGVRAVPVRGLALFMCVVGIAAMTLIAFKVQQLHFFALWIVIAGATVAYCHGRMRALASR